MRGGLVVAALVGAYLSVVPGVAADDAAGGTTGT